MNDESIRVFLGINFPVPVVRRVVDDLRDLQAQVKGAGFEVAWVPAANIHLTLKFLGNIAAISVEVIRDRLTKKLAERGPFELVAAGLGAFPSPAQPRIIWADVKESAPLKDLAADVEKWLVELGFPKEERPFHPHLTLGRVRRGAGSLAAILSSREQTVYGTGKITEVVIYESRVLRQAAEYIALARIPISYRNK